ncbi:hypothetical protein IMZ48_17700 [Candidatus Bathyarchaeota archaeon]|nr:hypothetical protein [Candidatus Bathyarchaeota archaeon]
MSYEDKNAAIPEPASGHASGMGDRHVASPTADFFRLPIEIRITIYKLVLTVRAPLYLFRNGKRVQAFAPEMRRRWLALLYTSRQLYGESSAVAYGSNRYIIMDTTKEVDLLRSFLEKIGPKNASSLSHLGLSFPTVETADDESGKARLGQDSLRAFKILQEKCKGIITLESAVSQSIPYSPGKPGHECLPLLEDAFCQIDAQLQALPTLRKFIVRVYDRNITSIVIGAMRSCGWVVYQGDQREPMQ